MLSGDFNFVKEFFLTVSENFRNDPIRYFCSFLFIFVLQLSIIKDLGESLVAAIVLAMLLTLLDTFLVLCGKKDPKKRKEEKGD